MKSSPRAGTDRKLVSVIMLFFFSGFLLVSFSQESIHTDGLILTVSVPALIWLSTMWLPRFFPADKLLLSITSFLCGLGVLVLYTTDIGADTSRGLQQAVYYGIGIAVMLVCIMAVRYIRRWGTLMKLMLAAIVVLLALPLALGTEVNGAKNWIYWAGISIQPSEAAKILLVPVLGWYMSRYEHLPWLGLSIACMLFLMLQKDLGTALVYYFTGLFMFFAATGNLPLTGVGLVGAGGAAVVGYKMFAHVKKRVAIWKNPWLYYETSGYQAAQMLMAIASGSWFGVGLGLGSPRTIPVYFTDSIFAVICEQFGIVFGVLVLVMYAILILRGASIAFRATDSFLALTAIGATALLGIQTFIIIGGVLKLIPLTGITMPFVSYGGSSMISCMGLIGIIQGISSATEDSMQASALKNQGL